MTHSKPGKDIEALVILNGEASLGGARLIQTKEAKGRFVRNELLNKANATQANLLAWLSDNKIEHRAFYIINGVWVQTTPEKLVDIAARPDVRRIEANPTIKNTSEPKLSNEELEEAAIALERDRLTALAPEAVELGISNTRAPEVWNQGYTGQGIVIGGADTGIKWDHSALKNQYRGWIGSAVSHDYNWHDSIHNAVGNPCGNDSTAPCDDDNHGTHTLGSALGTDGAANQIGMAPGAKWIGCRNMNSGNGTPARYIECMEWFLAPYPIGASPAQGDPIKAPDITINSWGCPASEGCSANSLQAAVEAQRAAGIMMVVAAGNEGPSCSTVGDPPSFYEATYSVGAFSASTGAIASFSSRGPILADGSNRMKPDIAAPGVAVRSAVKAGGYSSLSGTSMATPHVAGAIALLWSAVPSLQNKIQLTITLLNNAAVDVAATGCNSSGVPNNIWGWGKLDVKAAVDAAIAANCSYSLSPVSRTLSSISSMTSLNVITDSVCSWSATSNSSWIAISGNSTGTGNGTINLSVAANSGVTRTGTVTINHLTFSVVQTANNVTQDSDDDGIPDSIEVQEGTNVLAKDNDIFASTAKGNRLFVMQQYRDFLGREGEASGITSWTNALNADALNRAQVIESFFNSAEFGLTTTPLVRLYFATFLRIPDYAGLINWTNAYRAGTSLETIAASFVASPEFQLTYSTLTNSEFVTLLYNNILGRDPDATGLAYWLGALNNGTLTRGQVLLNFSESAEYQITSSNNIFVVMMYVGLLRRSPEQAGFTNWLGFLNQDNVRLSMIDQFSAATEYHYRFLP